MNTSSGLSSNTNTSANPLKLDASTRESIAARNQARLLASIGIGKADEFSSGNALNPLKGLYSAAAATFLKNKQSRQTADAADKPVSVTDQAVSAARALASSAGASSAASFETKTTGPASNGGYGRYKWTGQPGPTGTDVLTTVNETPAPTTEDPVDPTPVDEAPAGGGTPTIDSVMARLSTLVTDNGGSITDNGDGTQNMQVLDLNGQLTIENGSISAYIKSASGVYTFTLDAQGQYTVDASSGGTDTAEYDQVMGLINGSLDGVRRAGSPDPAPSDSPGAPSEPADSTATVTTTAAVPADSGSSTATSSSTTSSGSNTTSGHSSYYANSNALLTAFTSQLSGIGGTRSSVNSNNQASISVGGMNGTLEVRSDGLRGQLTAGLGQVEFRLDLNGGLEFQTSGVTLLYNNSISNLRSALAGLNHTSGVNVVV